MYLVRMYEYKEEFMNSEIRMDEILINKKRKFGGAKYYYPCTIIDENGVNHDALFTKNQLKVAMKRAGRNPEDIPEKESLWNRLFK